MGAECHLLLFLTVHILHFSYLIGFCGQTWEFCHNSEFIASVGKYVPYSK